MNKKYYEVGYCTATVEKTSSGYWQVTITQEQIPEGITYMFSNETEALREVLSYAETDPCE